MKIICLVLTALLGATFAVEAKNPKLKIVAKPNEAISRAVQSYTDKNSQDAGKVKITSSDIQGN